MARGAMERPFIEICSGVVVRTYRVVGAELKALNCFRQNLRQALCHAAQATKSALGTGGRGIDENTEAVGLARAAGIRFFGLFAFRHVKSKVTARNRQCIFIKRLMKVPHFDKIGDGRDQRRWRSRSPYPSQ